MRIFVLLLMAGAFFSSCGSGGGDKPFCDTVCTDNEIVFKGDAVFEQELTLKLNGCVGDSITWTHAKTFARTQIYLPESLARNGKMNYIKMNKAAINCAFQDTTMVWFTFNDCITGRGYLLKLPYRGGGMEKISGALTDFDPKFSVDADLRAYTDRGNLYVVNVVTGKEDRMTFGEQYDIDFDRIHESVDSVHVTKERMFIQLRDKTGNIKPFEKKIAL